jgi:tetratricopeptide (TPR) repeat protein
MNPPTHEFTMSLADFDSTLLPAGSPTKAAGEYALAVHHFLEEQFVGFGGHARIAVTPETITVQWQPATADTDPLDVAIAKLKDREFGPGIMLLELLRHQRQDNLSVLFNLGMAYSESGRVEEAVNLLDRAVRLDPTQVNPRVALGVALLRADRIEEAVQHLEQAVADAPDNAWAHRNLGAGLAKLGHAERAAECFEKAAQLNPQDQQAFFGLAEALKLQGKQTEADQAYRDVIKIDEYSEIAELARRGLSSLAEEDFRHEGTVALRMDAVLYCVWAMEKFDGLSHAEVRNIAYEIAMLGRQGFDVNSPDEKYQLRHMPGRFSGLQLLCCMYVGFQRIEPQMDLGFDLSNEYAMAKKMFEAKQDR